MPARWRIWPRRRRRIRNRNSGNFLEPSYLPLVQSDLGTIKSTFPAGGHVMRLIALITVATISLASFARAPSDPLVVHEWGTFTSLQDENGRSIGGLNVDDEPLPKFVHD